MNAVATPPPAVCPSGAPAAGFAPTTEGCPLCGAPLRAEQDWCLRCGAAARTRLAAPPKWRTLAAALLIVAAISLAVLTVALVKLAG